MFTPIDHLSVFVIIPAYDEKEVIKSVIDDLLPHNYKLVVIDDGSSTSLYPLLQNKPVYFLRHKVNLGQGAALQTGIEFALSKGAEYIVTFDADGQHDANDIEKLLQMMISPDTEIVFGSRFMQGAVHNMTPVRKLFLQLARYINYFFTGLLLTDAHNGLRAMSRSAAEKIRIKENTMAHATEILSQVAKKNISYKEVPVRIHYTSYSRKKGQSVWNGFRIFFDLLLAKIFR